MRPVCLFLFAAGAFGQLPPKDAADGWLMLFDGESLFGWAPQGTAKWSVAGGVLSAEGGEDAWLRHNAVFGDFLLRMEFRLPTKGANSGVFVRSAKEGAPHETGYEVQIWDANPKFATGSLVNHASARKVTLKPATWHVYEIQAEGDRFQVRLNGKQVLDARDSKSQAGHVGLQYKAGNKLEFRNIRLKPLGLKPIFNGKDLSGWRRVDTPRAKEPPVWTVKDGMLHVEKGAGQLETEHQYTNFVLQLDIRTNTDDPNRHPNSGVFMRGDPNEFWSGYESQIRNEFKGDPTQPVDFGTGAIYRYSPARKIVAKDNEFCTKTIVANGRHFNIWVNGYPVTDWEDPNPEGRNVRKKEARLQGGTLSLQAHDPTTNLDFNNIRIAELP
jgi:hypothetical protein